MSGEKNAWKFKGNIFWFSEEVECTQEMADMHEMAMIVLDSDHEGSEPWAELVDDDGVGASPVPSFSSHFPTVVKNETQGEDVMILQVMLKQFMSEQTK